LCFSVVDPRVNKEVLGNPLSHADALGQFEELGLTDFLAAEGFEAKSQEPPLKFPALLQGVIRFNIYLHNSSSPMRATIARAQTAVRPNGH